MADLLRFFIAEVRKIRGVYIVNIDSYIDVPDRTISFMDMRGYGYTWDGMLPLRKDMAERLFGKDLQVYCLYANDEDSSVSDFAEIDDHAYEGGIFGIEKREWQRYCLKKMLASESKVNELLTGVEIKTPRGKFELTHLSMYYMEDAGYGLHHTSDDGNFFIMTDSRRAFAVAKNPTQLAQAVRETLCDRLAAEQDKFRNWLMEQPADEILHHAYEYVTREDILMAFSEGACSVEYMGMLLKSHSSLQDLYKYWTKFETDYMQDVRDVIVDYTGRLELMEQEREKEKARGEAR